MHRSLSCSTTPSSVWYMQSTGHTAMHGASEQCMHATEIDFSPGTPSLRVTTRRRFTPQGTSFSCLQAVTQPLHSMQRSVSQINFILAMVVSPLSLKFFDLAQSGLGFLHHRHRIVAVGGGGVDRLTAHDWRRTLRVVVEHVLAHPPAGEVKL